MNGNEHWTEDDEMRERFVLHRIDEATMRSLDAHLASCAPCRRAIERERRIAGAVRRVGRDALKRRIAKRAGETASTPWPKVIAAAALVTIVVGVGTYFRWFETRTVDHETGNITLDDRVVAQDGKEMGYARGNASADSSGPPAVSFAESSQEEPVQAKESRRAAKTEVPLQESLPTAPSTAFQGGRDRDAAKESGQIAEIHSPYNARAEGTSVPVSFWMDGMVLNGENEIGREKQKEAADALSHGRKDEQVETMLEKKADTPVPAEQERYSVVQMPLTTLPTTQQFRQQSLGANTVQTEILKQHGTVRITLFTDTRFAPEDIAQARVQQIGQDSLVVQIRNQAIGYRLPAGWDAK